MEKQIVTEPKQTPEERIRQLEFALTRAISVIELVETNGGQVMSFKRLIRELKRELRGGEAKR